MPALIVKRPSVAPASRVGTTGTPGHICELTASIGPTISRVSGGGGERIGSCVGVILILSFARTQGLLHFRDRFSGEDAAVHRGACALGQGVGRMPCFEHGGDASGAE